MKILVVDDERGIGVMLGLMLRRLGHSPLLAVHPQDAIDMATYDIDAVITDIEMPIMDGVQLASAIRALDSDMPIAFCTGSDPSSEILGRATRYGRVLSKCWTIPKLKALVEELAADREAAEKRRRH